MATPSELGDYLRSRREHLNPHDVGLRDSGRRRTPGLRREEVATLAGISIDYLVRLEQGRDNNPSTEVVTDRTARSAPSARAAILGSASVSAVTAGMSGSKSVQI